MADERWPSDSARARLPPPRQQAHVVFASVHPRLLPSRLPVRRASEPARPRGERERRRRRPHRQRSEGQFVPGDHDNKANERFAAACSTVAMSPRRLLATLLLLASSLALLRHDAAAASRIIAAADLNGESMLDPSVIGNTRQVVRLDALKRQVIVEEIQPAAFTATDSNATEATQQLDTWLPYNLLVTSSPASAIVTGSVWSSPSPSKPSAVSASSSSSSSATARGATDATDWNTSRPIGMVAVATGQAIRMYTPAPANPFTTNTSSSAVKPPRELLAQPLLIGQGGIVALLYEIQSELCVCGMQTVVPPRPVASNSSLTTLLYVWDGEGNLNLMRLQQGRVSGERSMRQRE
jgi:hypothetical protein